MPLDVDALRRLADLYGMIEQQEALFLQKRVRDVVEAKQAIERQCDLIRASIFEERQAMMSGDRSGLILTAAQKDIESWRRTILEKAAAEREGLREEARNRYFASRKRFEQVERLLQTATIQAAVEQGRREQAHSDDRFLSRKQWRDSKRRAREDSRINLA